MQMQMLKLIGRRIRLTQTQCLCESVLWKVKGGHSGVRVERGQAIACSQRGQVYLFILWRCLLRWANNARRVYANVKSRFALRCKIICRKITTASAAASAVEFSSFVNVSLSLSLSLFRFWHRSRRERRESDNGKRHSWFSLQSHVFVLSFFFRFFFQLAKRRLLDS